MGTKAQKHLKDVLQYFEKTDDTYHIKKGYICIIDGFVNDYISMVVPNDDEALVGFSNMLGYSMASDNRYLMSDDNVALLDVYQLNKVTGDSNAR